MLQIEVKPNNFATTVMVSESPEMSFSQGYVNNAFEEHPRKADKVNDKHNVHIKYILKKSFSFIFFSLKKKTLIICSYFKFEYFTSYIINLYRTLFSIYYYLFSKNVYFLQILNYKFVHLQSAIILSRIIYSFDLNEK